MAHATVPAEAGSNRSSGNHPKRHQQDHARGREILYRVLGYQQSSAIRGVSGGLEEGAHGHLSVTRRRTQLGTALIQPAAGIRVYQPSQQRCLSCRRCGRSWLWRRRATSGRAASRPRPRRPARQGRTKRARRRTVFVRVEKWRDDSLLGAAVRRTCRPRRQHG